MGRDRSKKFTGEWSDTPRLEGRTTDILGPSGVSDLRNKEGERDGSRPLGRSPLETTGTSGGNTTVVKSPGGTVRVRVPVR